MPFNPSEELIMKAAKQNLETDQRRIRQEPAFFRDREDRAVLRMREPDELYIEEAKYLLIETGENYIPEFADHEHIKVPV